MRLRYLVTGTGRSGTVYMARLLTSVGLPCSHEMIFDYRGLHYAKKRLAGEMPLELSWVSRAKYDKGKWTELDSWLPEPTEVEAESSYMAAPYLSDECLRETTVIHVVRDPIKVVNSFCNYIDFFRDGEGKNSYEHFIYKNLPELKSQMPTYDRAALYWMRWNQMVENHSPVIRHRVEDQPDKVLALLGKTGPCFSDKGTNSFKKNVAERFSPNKIESKDILGEFMDMGKRYGYSMRSEYLLM